MTVVAVQAASADETVDRADRLHPLKQFVGDRLAATGLAIILVLTLAAVFAPLIAPYSPIDANPARFLEPPSWDPWMGTDAVGML